MTNETSPVRPIVLVSAVIYDDARRVLITRHAPALYWHLPDGNIAFGETTFQALRRSLNTDLSVPMEEVIKMALQPEYVTETIRPDRDLHCVTLHYRVALRDCGKIRPREGFESSFVPPHEALKMCVLESTRETLLALGHRPL